MVVGGRCPGGCCPCLHPQQVHHGLVLHWGVPHHLRLRTVACGGGGGAGHRWGSGSLSVAAVAAAVGVVAALGALLVVMSTFHGPVSRWLAAEEGTLHRPSLSHASSDCTPSPLVAGRGSLGD